VEDANAVIEWATAFTAREVLYMGKPDDRSFGWIEESFIASEALIQTALPYHIQKQRASPKWCMRSK